MAQIDAEGAFVAETPGKYTVTGTIGGQAAEAVVTVEARKVGRGIEVVGRVPITFRGAEVWVHQNGKCAYYSTIADRVYAIDVTDPGQAGHRRFDDDRRAAGQRRDDDRRRQVRRVLAGRVVEPEGRHRDLRCQRSLPPQGDRGVHRDGLGRRALLLRVQRLRLPHRRRHRLDADHRHPRSVQAARGRARWQTSQTEAGRYVHDIAIDDGLAYLSYWNDGLIILDVGNGMKGGTAEKPVQVAQLKYDLNALYSRVDQMYGLGARGTHTSWRKGKYVFIADEVYASRDATPACRTATI